MLRPYHVEGMFIKQSFEGTAGFMLSGGWCAPLGAATVAQAISCPLLSFRVYVGLNLGSTRLTMILSAPVTSGATWVYAPWCFSL